MPIIVNSPFSGKPVKVRDQDVGRSVRDEEGRVFYVLQRSDGAGYYSSPTRQGGAKDQDRYDKMAGKLQRNEEHVEEQTETFHDATGKRRGSMRGKLVILFLVVVVVLLVLYTKTNLLDKWKKPPPAGTMPVSLIEKESISPTRVIPA